MTANKLRRRFIWTLITIMWVVFTVTAYNLLVEDPSNYEDILARYMLTPVAVTFIYVTSKNPVE